MRRNLPIITTPHAKHHLHDAKASDGEAFTNVSALDFFQSMLVDIKVPGQRARNERMPRIKVTGMPGKHVPSGGVIGTANDLLQAV